MHVPLRVHGYWFPRRACGASGYDIARYVRQRTDSADEVGYKEQWINAPDAVRRLPLGCGVSIASPTGCGE